MVGKKNRLWQLKNWLSAWASPSIENVNTVISSRFGRSVHHTLAVLRSNLALFTGICWVEKQTESVVGTTVTSSLYSAGITVGISVDNHTFGRQKSESRRERLKDKGGEKNKRTVIDFQHNTLIMIRKEVWHSSLAPWILFSCLFSFCSFFNRILGKKQLYFYFLQFI